MKKSLLVALIALLALAFAVSLVNAAPPVASPSQTATLTDAQRQELVPLYNQMIDIRKQILQKFVADGVMTQVDADQRAAWMQERMNNRMQNGMIGGPGMGHGPGMMGSGHGRGPGCGSGQQQPLVNQ